MRLAIALLLAAVWVDAVASGLPDCDPSFPCAQMGPTKTPTRTITRTPTPSPTLTRVP